MSPWIVRIVDRIHFVDVALQHFLCRPWNFWRCTQITAFVCNAAIGDFFLFFLYGNKVILLQIYLAITKKIFCKNLKFCNQIVKLLFECSCFWIVFRCHFFCYRCDHKPNWNYTGNRKPNYNWNYECFDLFTSKNMSNNSIIVDLNAQIRFQ